MVKAFKKRFIVLFTILTAALLMGGGIFMLAPRTAYAEEVSGAATVQIGEGEPVAYDSIEQAWAAANNAETAATVTMLADAETTDTLTVEKNKNITLNLNGCMLKYNGEENKPVITVEGSTFTLKDNSDTTTAHTITNPVTNEEVTIDGGLITGGKDGGVYVNCDGDYYADSIAGTFMMKGGTISGNTSLWSGGGVFVGGGSYGFPSSTFTMTGGTISGNKAADNGGGVYVASQVAADGESLNLTTRSNTVNKSGEREEGGLFIMTGGTISGNTARYGGGVFVGGRGEAEGGNFETSGAPVITGNQKAGGNDNVYLDSGWDGSTAVIKVTGALTEGAQIGVTLADGYSGVFTSGYGEHNDGVSPSTCFISDAEGYVVVLDGDEVKLVAGVATVTVDGVETAYGTIEEAFTYANDNSDFTTSATVKMFADAETTDTLTVEEFKSITLDLNGCMLKYTGNDNKSVITVNSRSTLTLDDSNSQAEHYYKIEDSGLWTFGFGDGYTHTLHGGVITGGKGSGVLLLSFSSGAIRGSTFIMGNGNICGNADSGVCVSDLGNFEMKAGRISGNTAENGGGVNFSYDTSFTMTGGVINENTASNNGGGISWSSSLFFGISGAPVITGNKANGSNNNVYLAGAFSKIKVTGALEKDGKKAQIGVNSTGVVATGFTGENFEGKDPSEFFIPDNPENNCVYVSNEENGTVNIGTHTGGTATCTQKAQCLNCGEAYGEVDNSNHDYTTEFTIDKAATCTEAGSKSKHCSRCGDKSEITVIPALGHTLTYVPETAATEEAEGNLEHWECENCDKIFSDAEGTAEITDKSSVVTPKLTAQQPEPDKENDNMLWIILIVVLIVIILVVIAVVVYLAKRKNKSKENRK